MPAPVNRRPPTPLAGSNSGLLPLAASGRRQHWSEVAGLGRGYANAIPPIPFRIEGAAEISASRLAKVVGAKRVSARLIEAAAALEAHRLSGDINTPLRAAHFVAQCAHESWGFSRLVESFKYSAANAFATFKSVKTEEEAANLLKQDKNGEALANHVYGNRTDLGNDKDGDGFKYRGRGYIQLTGKYNYSAAGKDLKVDLVEKPERAAEVDLAAQTSVWFWKKNAINAMADLDDVVAVTRIINKKLKGLSDRRTKTELALKAFGLSL